MITVEAIKEKAGEQGVSISLVFKEYLHWVVLEYLFRKGLFSQLVFRGGSALRFVYGGVRYSEDLDFVLKRKNSSFFNRLSQDLKPLPSYVERLLPFIRNAQLKIQKETQFFKRYHLVLEVEFLRAKDRTNIEIVNVPSYSNEAIILHHKDIPLTPAIVVEKPQEILSDKLLAFCARDYLKGRDLWDIYFIMDTLKIVIDENIKNTLKKKVSDYGLTLKEFPYKFEKNLLLLKKKGEFILKTEMDRFLPLAYQDMFKTKYRKICQEETEVLNNFLEEFKRK